MQVETSPSNLVGNRALDIARSKLGLQEQGGPNQGPIVTWSITPWPHDNPKLGMKWCAGFACTCLLLAGTKMREVGSLSCSTLWLNCQKRGWAWRFHFDEASLLPNPGNLVFFAQKEEIFHVGLVEILDREKNCITAIEGNSGNAVRRNTYSLSASEVYGFARILNEPNLLRNIESSGSC